MCGDKAQIAGLPRVSADRCEMFLCADAAFLAAAREDVPWLCDRLAEAQARITELEDMNERLAARVAVLEVAIEKSKYEIFALAKGDAGLARVAELEAKIAALRESINLCSGSCRKDL